MKKKFSCILLIDDSEDCNYMLSRTLRKMDCTEKIQVAMNGKEAIEYLVSREGAKYPQPELIFLDVNMPVLNGWEFLEEYDKLDENQKAGVILIMLTTSLSERDQERASQNKYIKEFVSKYLDEKSLETLFRKHFQDYF